MILTWALTPDIDKILPLENSKYITCALGKINTYLAYEIRINLMIGFWVKIDIGYLILANVDGVGGILPVLNTWLAVYQPL